MIIEPGFFSSDVVHTALVIGAAVAIVSGPLGVFTVIRGQSFAGHAFGDIGTTGGSGAFLVGVGPLWGFLVINVVASALMELVGVQRRSGRDLATGIVFGAALGVSALLIYLATTIHDTTGATVTIFFGSLFYVASSSIPLVIALALIIVGLLALIARPLLLSSVGPELAAARGVPVGAVGYAYLLALSLSAALCAFTIGAILATALLIGPAAAALRIVRRPGLAMATAAGLGVAATWVGVLLAYDSYDWSRGHTGWPVSFFVVALVFVIYLVCGAVGARRRSGATRGQGSGAEPIDLAPPATLGG